MDFYLKMTNISRQSKQHIVFTNDQIRSVGGEITRF